MSLPRQTQNPQDLDTEISGLLHSIKNYGAQIQKSVEDPTPPTKGESGADYNETKSGLGEHENIDNGEKPFESEARKSEDEETVEVEENDSEKSEDESTEDEAEADKSFTTPSLDPEAIKQVISTLQSMLSGESTSKSVKKSLHATDLSVKDTVLISAMDDAIQSTLKIVSDSHNKLAKSIDTLNKRLDKEMKKSKNQMSQMVKTTSDFAKSTKESMDKMGKITLPLKSMVSGPQLRYDGAEGRPKASEVFEKSRKARAEGKISLEDTARIESLVRQNQDIGPDFRAKLGL